MGKAVLYGLQSNDPKYLKIYSCAKHYAIHRFIKKKKKKNSFVCNGCWFVIIDFFFIVDYSGPEPEHHWFNVQPTPPHMTFGPCTSLPSRLWWPRLMSRKFFFFSFLFSSALPLPEGSSFVSLRLYIPSVMGWGLCPCLFVYVCICLMIMRFYFVYIVIQYLCLNVYGLRFCIVDVFLFWI
jgi:hypothetical protein